jgi:large repetitive protein
VTLRATNGCSDTSGTETITVFPKPVAAFTASTSNACINSEVNFTNQSDSATGYQWQFGDGTVSTLTNPVHAYATPGNYTVMLTAMHVNAPGNVCTDTALTTLQVVTSRTGSFSATDTIGTCAPFTATFTNNITPATAVWNFGDGNTATGNIVTHTFNAPGNYTVLLTATYLEDALIFPVNRLWCPRQPGN